MHYQRWYRYGDPLEQRRIHGDDDRRFWSKVNMETANGCWMWTDVPGKHGYAQVRMGGRGGKFVLVHRWAYENLVGPIPEGLTVDHQCHNRDASCPGGDACEHRRCVNPDHLEAVSLRENTLRSGGASAVNARKTHCKRGHPFDEANTCISKDGNRSCRACRLAYVRAWRAKEAAKKAA
jgi:hypothetical protein